MLPYIVTSAEFYPATLLASVGNPDLSDVAYLTAPPTLLHLYDQSRRGQIDDSVTTIAFIDDGIWKTCCPWCPSAQVVSPDDPRFLCAGRDGCANGLVQGAYIRVLFPENRADIEAALLLRPNMVNRNWREPETVDTLLAENAANGVTG